MPKNPRAALAAALHARLAIDKSLGIKFVRCSLSARQNLLSRLVSSPANQAPAAEKSRVPAAADFVRTASEATPAAAEICSPRKNLEPCENKNFTPSEPCLTGAPEAVREAKEWFAKTAQCRACSLALTRRQAVFGEGALDAKIMFILDAPGKDDDLTGRPAQGEAGELLAAIIEKGLKTPREKVFVTSLIKCRPPGNRRAKTEEFSACEKFWQAQIAIIEPKVIVALGETAAQVLTGSSEKIAALRGQKFLRGEIAVIPTYHPAFLAQMRIRHGMKNDFDRAVWEDVKKITALSET